MTKGELLFNAWLTSVNQRLGRYTVRLMDEAAPASTTEYTVPLAEVEAELGEDLMELALAISEKAVGGLPQPDNAAVTGRRPTASSRA